MCLIRAYVIIKIYAIKVSVIKAYTNIAYVIQHMPLNITRDLGHSLRLRSITRTSIIEPVVKMSYVTYHYAMKVDVT
jgi:hypothetical protein